MIYLAREISKLIMFTILWGFPILLAHLNKSNYFLWFFILSFIGNLQMFWHYESLSEDESRKTSNDTEQ